MFKSYREFTIEKPIDREKFKVIHKIEGDPQGPIKGLAVTIVRLWATDVVRRVNTNNVVTLKTGGWYTPSTKHVINRALQCIYGEGAPYVYQLKGKWYVMFNTGEQVDFFDNMIIGGGHGAPFQVLNK